MNLATTTQEWLRLPDESAIGRRTNALSIEVTAWSSSRCLTPTSNARSSPDNCVKFFVDERLHRLSADIALRRQLAEAAQDFLFRVIPNTVPARPRLASDQITPSR